MSAVNLRLYCWPSTPGDFSWIIRFCPRKHTNTSDIRTNSHWHVIVATWSGTVTGLTCLQNYQPTFLCSETCYYSEIIKIHETDEIAIAINCLCTEWFTDVVRLFCILCCLSVVLNRQRFNVWRVCYAQFLLFSRFVLLFILRIICVRFHNK